MAAYYFDSSAIVKYYLDEPGSVWVGAILADPTVPVFISPIAGPEVLAAVMRKGRRGELDPEAQDEAARSFHGDFVTRFVHGALDLRTVRHAMDLIRQHPLRAYDAVQLATSRELTAALPRELSPLTFVSADSALNQIAERLGLPTDDPRAHA